MEYKTHFKEDKMSKVSIFGVDAYCRRFKLSQNLTTDPALVTCKKCLEKMEESGIKIPEKVRLFCVNFSNSEYWEVFCDRVEKNSVWVGGAKFPKNGNSLRYFYKEEEAKRAIVEKLEKDYKDAIERSLELYAEFLNKKTEFKI